MPTINEIWDKYKFTRESGDYIDQERFIEAVAEIISLPVEAQVGKNLAEENKEGLTEWRTILLNEKHHSLLKHILEIGIKDGWLANEETKKLLRIITTAEKMDYYVGRKLTKAKLDKLTKFLQEQY